MGALRARMRRVVAALRRLFDMSEFISTLMLNMIADFFTAWVIAYPPASG